MFGFLFDVGCWIQCVVVKFVLFSGGSSELCGLLLVFCLVVFSVCWQVLVVVVLNVISMMCIGCVWLCCYVSVLVIVICVVWYSGQLYIL